MRSGSTLLSHVLANHPDFVGAGETHLRYENEKDLSRLVLRTSELLHRPLLKETYVVDQINHAYFSKELLHSPRLYKCIILIREPCATLKSMMSLSIWEEQQAVEIYTRRLEGLAEYGKLLGSRAIVVQYDHLVDQTDHTLASLTKFLHLGTPLTSDYATHRMTNRISGFGDPSGNIKAGQIIKTTPHAAVLSTNCLEQASIAFHKCLNTLQNSSVETTSINATGN